MIYLPGYGLYPRHWIQHASKVRFQGQANREMLEAENMGDVPSHVLAARESLERHFGISGGSRPPWFVGSGISTVGLQQWSLSIAAGRKVRLEDFRDSRDAIEILIHKDPQWDEVARRIPPAVNGVPVFVHRSGFPVMLADDDSTVMAHNWTGTRGGWYDYAGSEMTPGGADDMSDVSHEVRIPMLVTGPTLNELLLNKVAALGGEYRPVAGEWRFFIDPVVRVKLGLAGLPAPCSVKAEPLVCLRAPPPLPTLGGFMHPGVGVYCRPAGIPEGLLHRYRVVLSRASTFGMADAPGALKKAEQAAIALNASLGRTKPRWWLYTLPRVNSAGNPEVAVGVAGDVTMDRTLPASFAGVALVQEIAYPKHGMGSAPIDTVWPTDSPDYHSPTGDATGDDDPAISDVEANPYNSLCPTCGRPAVGATKCIPGSYFCANRHEWTPALKEKAMGNGVFVTMSDLVSSGLSKQDPSWGDDGTVESMPKGAGTILMGEKTEHWRRVHDVIREINGELVKSMPPGSATMDADPYDDNDMADLLSSRSGVPASKTDMAVALAGMLAGGVAGSWVADKKGDMRPMSLGGLASATVGAGVGLALVKVGQRLFA